MFEFSRPTAAEVSFRSQAAERVLRQYEASGSKTSARKLSASELRIQLRPVGERSVSVKFSSVSVTESGSIPIGSLLVSNRSRQFASAEFASRDYDLKRVLSSMTTKSKRAASLIVFQRMRERFVRLSPIVCRDP